MLRPQIVGLADRGTHKVLPELCASFDALVDANVPRLAEQFLSRHPTSAKQRTMVLEPMRQVAYLLWLLGLCFQWACRREQVVPLQPAARDAGSVLSAAASEVSAIPGPSEPVDLLTHSESLVAVSSERDARSRGRFLVDGREDTVWRPGFRDSQPWVDLVVPAHANITELIVTSGNGRSTRKPSPLAAGTLEVTHDGEVLGQLDLVTGETNRWQPTHPLAGMRIRLVLHVSAGARKSFPGLAAVSLLGALPAQERLSSAAPSVDVSSLRSRGASGSATLEAWWRGGPYATLRTACAVYRKLYAGKGSPSIAATAAPPSCRLLKTLQPEGTSPPEISRVHLVAVTLMPPNEQEMVDKSQVLVFETTRGFYPGGLCVNSDPGAGDDRATVRYVVHVEKTSWIQGNLVLQLLRHAAVGGGYGADAVYAVGETWLACNVEARPACRRELVAWGDTDARANPGDFAASYPNGIPIRPTIWQWQREATVLPSGHFRLGPCHDKDSRSVPCYADAEDVLP